MLFAVIGGTVAGACLIFIAWAVYDQSVNIPSKSLVRKWRRETAARAGADPVKIIYEGNRS